MKVLALSVLVIVCAYSYASVVPKVSDSDDGVYQIIDGKCDSALAKDEIYREHVHKTRLPLIARDATSSWNGTQTIYCLKVLNDKEESKGTTCKVTSGGVGYKNVTIAMHSPMNHGLEFDIQIFAV